MGKYKLVTVGGTFDRLHKGHRVILKKAFEISERVIIGITSDKMARDSYQKSFNKNINSYQERKEEVEKFLLKEDLIKRVVIMEINDMFGSLKESVPIEVEKSKIEAMIISPQTRENAEKINQWRKEKGLIPVDLIEVPMVLAEDGVPISSNRIRKGEINREGFVYRQHKIWGKLPQSMRETLRIPLGEVVDNLQEIAAKQKQHCLVITVGDASTREIIKMGIKPDVVVFDFKIRRETVYENPSDLGIGEDYKIIMLDNPPGNLNSRLAEYFSLKNFESLEEKLGILIEGEEDLVALSIILFAPLGSLVLYGQPPMSCCLEDKGGLVAVEVTEEKKEEVFKILQKFER